MPKFPSPACGRGVRGEGAVMLKGTTLGKIARREDAAGLLSTRRAVVQTRKLLNMSCSFLAS